MREADKAALVNPYAYLPPSDPYRLRPYTKSRKYGVFLFLENANAENQRRARREAGKRGYERVRQQYSYSSPGERPRFLSPNCIFAASIISSICGSTYPISTASFLFERKKTFKISFCL